MIVQGSLPSFLNLWTDDLGHAHRSPTEGQQKVLLWNLLG
jgi:hypothetical protein